MSYIMSKVIISFLTLFLCCINNVVWAGEYLDKGCDYLQVKHQYVEADKYLTLAIEKEGSGIALLYRASNYERNLKKYEAAINDYTNYIEKVGDCNTSIAIAGRGNCYYQLGDYNKAIADYSTVIDSEKYDPNYMWLLYFNRAQAFNKIGNKGNALEDCNKAVTLVESGKSYKNLYNEKAELFSLKSTLTSELNSK